MSAQHTPGASRGYRVKRHPFIPAAWAVWMPGGFMRNEAGGVCHWWRQAEARAAIAKATGGAT